MARKKPSSRKPKSSTPAARVREKGVIWTGNKTPKKKGKK